MSDTQRRLTKDEQRELDALNAAVTDAIAARRKWLDAKMHETSRLQPGDDIYDVRKGQRLGVVSELYRYHTGRNDLYDTDPSCDYRYETSPRCFDNTSRQVGLWYGTQQEAADYAEWRASQFRVGVSSGIEQP